MNARNCIRVPSAAWIHGAVSTVFAPPVVVSRSPFNHLNHAPFRMIQNAPAHRAIGLLTTNVMVITCLIALFWSTKKCHTFVTNGLDINECNNDLTCQHGCTNLAGSYKCSCPKGYRLNPDGRTCEDINECKEQNFKCGKGVCLASLNRRNRSKFTFLIRSNVF